MSSSLERLYDRVRSGYSLICEDVGNEDDSPSVLDEEVQHLVPDEYHENYVQGTAKLTPAGPDGQYRGSFWLKFQTSQWTDGTESLEDTFRYVEKAVQSNLFNTSGGPGEPFVKSYAVVQDGDSNDQVIVVKCVFSGGFDI